MSGCVTRFQVLRGTAAQRGSFTPLKGEFIYDTTINRMFVGDGFTVGGNPIEGITSSTITAIYTASQLLTVEDYAIGDSLVDFTFTLPDADSRTRPINVKNINDGILTVVGTGGQLIDGFTDVQLNKTNAYEFIPKSGAWYVW